MDLQHNIYDGMKWRFTDNGIYIVALTARKKMMFLQAQEFFQLRQIRAIKHLKTKIK